MNRLPKEFWHGLTQTTSAPPLPSFVLTTSEGDCDSPLTALSNQKPAF